MKKSNIYLSTIAPDSTQMARDYGIGLELAEFCTAWNMDERFTGVDRMVQKKVNGISNRLIHGPYNELFPCAIDKKARELAAYRYRQAVDLAKYYGATKVVIHGGYNPKIYFPDWYTKQSILFWKEFLKDDPGVEIVLENVMEEDPAWLLDIIKGVDDPRLRMCLDIGHVNVFSEMSVLEWLEICAPWISHFHIHNNDGTMDQHQALPDGTIPMQKLLLRADELCPDATFTFELMRTESSMVWLSENKLI